MFPPAAFRDQKLQGCGSDGFPPHVIRDFIWPPSEGTSWETDRANKFESRNEFPLQGGTLEVAQELERRRHTEGSRRDGLSAQQSSFRSPWGGDLVDDHQE